MQLNRGQLPAPYPVLEIGGKPVKAAVEFSFHRWPPRVVCTMPVCFYVSGALSCLRPRSGASSPWIAVFEKHGFVYPRPNQATSAWVAQELERLGFPQVYVLVGGWKAWEEKEYPRFPRSRIGGSFLLCKIGLLLPGLHPSVTIIFKEKIVRKGLLLALVGVLLLLPLATALPAKQEIKSIDVETLKGMLGDPQVMIFDVRAPISWADSDKKIKGAVRQDPGKVPTWAKTLPKAQKIVL